MNVASLWMRAVSSSTNGPPTLITGAGNPVTSSNFAATLQLLGTTKQGIIEINVISEEEFALCPSCNHQGIADSAMLQRLLTRCIDVRRLCTRCAQQQGFPQGVDEVILPGGIQVHVLRDSGAVDRMALRGIGRERQLTTSRRASPCSLQVIKILLPCIPDTEPELATKALLEALVWHCVTKRATLHGGPSSLENSNNEV